MTPTPFLVTVKIRFLKWVLPLSASSLSGVRLGTLEPPEMGPGGFYSFPTASKTKPGLWAVSTQEGVSHHKHSVQLASWAQPVLIFSCSASFDIQLPSQFWYSAGQLVLIFSCSATNQQLAIWNLRLQLNPKCILYQSSCSSNYHKHWDSSNLKTSI